MRMTANLNQLVFDLKKFAKKNLLTSFIIFRVWSAWKIAKIQFFLHEQGNKAKAFNAD